MFGLMVAKISAEFWVRAYLRRCHQEAVSVVVSRRGDSTAGVVVIKLNLIEKGCVVLTQIRLPDGKFGWRHATGQMPVAEKDADKYIDRQIRYDPDIWVLEIEDRSGRHLLQEPIE